MVQEADVPVPASASPAYAWLAEIPITTADAKNADFHRCIMEGSFLNWSRRRWDDRPQWAGFGNPSGAQRGDPSVDCRRIAKFRAAATNGGAPESGARARHLPLSNLPHTKSISSAQPFANSARCSFVIVVVGS